MKDLIAKALNHLKYPSTIQGILGLAAAAGLVIKPELQEQIIAAGVAVAGLIAFLFSDADVKKKK